MGSRAVVTRKDVVIWRTIFTGAPVLGLILGFTFATPDYTFWEKVGLSGLFTVGVLICPLWWIACFALINAGWKGGE